MNLQTVLFIIALVGCFVGMAGWLTSREKKIEYDSEWRGNVNGKLDAILGIDKRVDRLEDKVEKQGKEIVEVDQSIKSAHRRLDDIERIKNKNI